MAENHYSADSPFPIPPRVAFAVHPVMTAAPVFVFDHGFVPARETFPIVSIID